MSAARHRLLPDANPDEFTSQKFALFRYQPWVRFSEGVHFASNLSVYGHPVWLAHFKYHAGFKEKVLTEIRRRQHFNDAIEYRRYSSLIKEVQGGLYQTGVSTEFIDSRSFSFSVD